MKATWMFLFVAVFWCTAVCGQEFDPHQGPAPVIVLMQDDPWAMVIGSDTPQLVVYEDRSVIYTVVVQNRVEHRIAHLDETRFGELRAQVRPLLTLPALKIVYDLAPGVTDQPMSSLFVTEGGKIKVVRVYGLTSQGRSHKEVRQGEDPPPAEFMKIHGLLASFTAAESKPWSPSFIEVMLWDYSYAPEASIVWPKEWPDLDSARAKRRGKSFSIYLDGARLDALNTFLATQREKGAVELGGRKFAADYRFVMPSEPVWKKAFDEARE